MITSMTGYGRAQEITGGREITVEIRSVNHRYFEAAVRVPRFYSFLEERVKSAVQEQVSRGKIEVVVSLTDAGESLSGVELNLPLARSYAGAMARMAEELDIRNDVSASVVARFPEVIELRRAQPDEDTLWADVRGVLNLALERYRAMREAEGQKMYEDIAGRCAYIRARITEIEERSTQRMERYRDKLLARMKGVLETAGIDESRILLEAALYADKSAIDEETVRLGSHLKQFEVICASDQPVGRKLDFLVQEINREINTIGSKAADYDITTAVVDLKAEVEKIREQIQNIE